MKTPESMNDILPVLDDEAEGKGSAALSRRSFLRKGAKIAVAGPAALAGLNGGMVFAQAQQDGTDQSMIPNVSAVLMDSYGTVFNTSYLQQVLQGIVPNPEQFAKNWIDTQLKWTLTLASMGPHAYFDWWELTHRTLRWMEEAHQVQLSEQEFENAVQAWLNLPPYPDAEVLVKRLEEAGIPNAILSNGSPMMLEAAARNAGWLDALEHIISADRAHVYKSNPNVYLLTSDVFGVPAKQNLLFISAHGWDVSGAKAAGLPTVYLNRKNEPMWNLGYQADYVFNDMIALADAIIAGRQQGAAVGAD